MDKEQAIMSQTNERTDVTVLIVTYNPEKSKLERTLNSVILQKGVEFEIVICDDGSEQFDKEYYEEYISQRFDKNFNVIHKDSNTGTVKNTVCGLKQAKGEFVYLISPGDMLFEPNTLRDLLVFIREKNVDMCFGLTQHYSYTDNKLRLKTCRFPRRIKHFAENSYSQDWVKIALLNASGIVGASYFRRTEAFLRYLLEVEEQVKYLEDMSSTLLYLYEDNKVLLYDHFVVWYEMSEGISSSRKRIWKNRIDADISSIVDMMTLKYPQDKFLKARKCYGIRRVFQYPSNCCKVLFLIACSYLEKKKRVKTVNDLTYVQELMLKNQNP